MLLSFPSPAESPGALLICREGMSSLARSLVRCARHEEEMREVLERPSCPARLRSSILLVSADASEIWTMHSLLKSLRRCWDGSIPSRARLLSISCMERGISQERALPQEE